MTFSKHLSAVISHLVVVVVKKKFFFFVYENFQLRPDVFVTNFLTLFIQVFMLTFKILMFDYHFLFLENTLVIL